MFESFPFLKKYFWWFILLVIITKLSIYIIANRYVFVRQFNEEYFGDLYSKSQYVKGELSKGGIGDDGLYAFAGYYYFFDKGDVSSVNFEHPPLGKYLIGLSIFIFNNENVINIIYLALLLLFTYLLSKKILKSSILSLIPLILISFEPLLMDNLIRSMLDLPFTLFFTLAVYFFLKGIEQERFFYLSNLFSGAAFTTRFFPALFLIHVFLLLYLYFNYRTKLIIFIKSSILIPLVYLIFHLSFFIYHPSILDFVKHKVWMISWFTGSSKKFGNLVLNVFTGKYIDSTGNLVINPHWSFILPIVILLAVLRIRKELFRKSLVNLFLIYTISLIYLFYATVITIGDQKFIMHIYPLLSVLAVSNAVSLYSIISPWIKRKNLLKSKEK